MIKVVFWVIIFFLVVYLSLYVTGRDKRSYQVINKDAVIVVNQEELKVSQLALTYQPRMFISSSTPSPKLLWTWYEIIPRDSEVDIVYYQNWEDEINPNRIIHNMYKLFRAMYYGYPTYDIEYFQVSVLLETGKVTQLLFETSPGDDYYVTISEHLTARYIRQSDDIFLRTLTPKDDDKTVLDESLVTILFDEDHALVLAQTWNHLSALITTPNSDLVPLESPLKYLTDKDYSSLKFSRKSQGDYKTIENKVSSIIAGFGIFVLVLLPTWIIRYFAARQNEKGGDRR